jgi:hypothetical protein
MLKGKPGLSCAYGTPSPTSGFAYNADRESGHTKEGMHATLPAS